MSGLHLVKVALTVVAKLPRPVLERELPVSPEIIGAELARQVDEFARREGLGYYPALEYVQANGGAESGLLETADRLAWRVSNTVQEEVREKLGAVFSSVTFHSIQSTAYAMPSVRPHQSHALRALARHYTPGTVKLALVVSSFQKRGDPEAMVQWARHLIWRWLKGSFETLEVTSARLL